MPKLLRKKLCKNKACKVYYRPQASDPDFKSWCSPECGLAITGQIFQSNKKKAKRESVKQRKEYYAKDKGYQFQLTKGVIQRLACLLDSELPCISCGTVSDVQYCGGHYKTAGAHPELALDIRNIRRQCNRRCNCALSGNIEGNKTTHGYKAGLIEREGQEMIDYLESYHPPKNYTCEQLIAMRKEFNAEIRRLEKGLPPSKDWRAIPKLEEQVA